MSITTRINESRDIDGPHNIDFERNFATQNFKANRPSIYGDCSNHVFDTFYV
jgi:hypothetical protein